VAVACASAHLGLVYGMYTELLARVHQERHAQTSANTSRSPGAVQRSKLDCAVIFASESVMEVFRRSERHLDVVLRALAAHH
jgi:hypothetical protein